MSQDTKYVIDEIRKNHKITDYLSDRGIHPKRSDSMKSQYHCPLPGHSLDKTPSFNVYHKDDHEDFFCYGCKRGGSIIQLMVEYEHIGFEEAIRRLSEGLNLDVATIMDALITECMMDSNENFDFVIRSTEIAFCINKKLYDFLKAVEFDPKGLEFVETIGKLVDKFLYAGNYEKLKEMIEESGPTSLDGYIQARVKSFNSRKAIEEINQLKAGGSDGNAAQKVLREDG